MTIYDKILRVFAMLQGWIEQKADLLNFADAFSEDKTYEVGRMCVHDEKLYRCTEDHFGPWDESHFTQTTVDEVLSTKPGGPTPSFDGIYVKDASTGLYHKVTIEKSGDVFTLAVDQDGVSK